MQNELGGNRVAYRRNGAQYVGAARTGYTLTKYSPFGAPGLASELDSGGT